MHICKKVILSIIGIVFPILALIAWWVNGWFSAQLETTSQLSKQNFSTQVQAVIGQNQSSFEQYAALYANTYDILVEQSQSHGDARLPSLPEGVEVFRYSPMKPKYLYPLHSQAAQSSSLAFQQALNQTFAHDSGFVWLGGQAYLMQLVPIAGGESLVFRQSLTPSYLAKLTTASARNPVSSDTLSPVPKPMVTNATQFDVENYAGIRVALPAFAQMPSIYLHVPYHPAIAAGLTRGIAWLPGATILLGLLIVALACLWLKRAVVEPFAELNQQLEAIDPDAKCVDEIKLKASKEFTKVVEQFNHLLKTISLHKERAKVTLEAINDAVIVTNTDANICYLNPQAESLFGHHSKQAFGKDIDQLVSSDSLFTPMISKLFRSDDHQTLSNKVKLRTQSPKIAERNISKLFGYQGEVIGSVIVIRDITQEELLKSELRRRANFDRVTGLLNRSAFEYQVESFIANAQSVAICYMDLEQFKLINDNCGHSAGDEMLALVARAMQRSLAGRGLLARLGGDEFGLVLQNYSKHEAELLLKLLIHSVSSQVMHNDDCHHSVGLSVGVAFVEGLNRPKAMEMLKDADIACLAAKRKGNNQIHFYDDHDKELNYQRNAPKWAVRIAQAIEHNELLLYYQPIKGLAAHCQRKRLEILLRILEPNGNILPPAQFIAAAERFKLMTEVDKDVIRKAFLWLSLHEEVWHDHCLSINLSGNSLGAVGMIEYIKEQQARFEVPSECICFEITETSAIQNQTRAMEMLKQLRALGFAFALDDFGTGFASYGYLRELPVDYVKIDGCFIKSLATNAKDYAIVKSIHDVSISMGIQTVAEFVENQDIIEALHEIGINYAQGYAIGRPKPLEEYLPLRSAKRA